MASFVEDLWSSIFTPGPTPTLLIATNVSFAALQLVLFALLLATSSLHFVALSLISAGLWCSINWFAREVRAAQDAQNAEKAKEKADPETETADRKKESGDSSAGLGVGADADSETETESIARGKTGRSTTATASVTSARLQPAEQDPRKRVSSGGDSSGYGSTDSEWEKVDEKS